MKFSHLHVDVQDLPTAVRWLNTVAGIETSYENGRMATFALRDDLSLILDAADRDAPATLAFTSTDCDADYDAFLARGAKSSQPPENLAWGVRAAYLQGPGALTIEIEQPLP